MTSRNESNNAVDAIGRVLENYASEDNNSQDDDDDVLTNWYPEKYGDQDSNTCTNLNTQQLHRHDHRHEKLDLVKASNFKTAHTDANIPKICPNVTNPSDDSPRFQFCVSGHTVKVNEPTVSPPVHSIILGHNKDNPVAGCSKDSKKNYTFQFDVVTSTPVATMESPSCKSLSSFSTDSLDLSKTNMKNCEGCHSKSVSASFMDDLSSPKAPSVVRKRICRRFDTRLSPVAMVTPTKPSLLQLYSLPVEILDHILSFFTFGEICKLRLVSKTFDEICQGRLNKTFSKLQVKLQQDCHSIKAQMPRRESARRKHPLVRECDIIETLHMRVTLLQMTFGKHIERKHICFFPGEILDEVFRILHYVKSTVNPARAYKVTDELFDLSTMAMEYFKERLEPRLPAINYFTVDYTDLNTSLSTPTSKQLLWKFQNSPSSSSTPATPDGNPAQKHGNTEKLSKLTRHLRTSAAAVVTLRKELKSCKNKMANQHKQLIECNSRLEQHERKFEEQSKKIDELMQQLTRYKSGFIQTPSAGQES